MDTFTSIFNVVPCEDYLGLYALHKHDAIGGKPVSTMILVGGSIMANSAPSQKSKTLDTAHSNLIEQPSCHIVYTYHC